jgi:hypothetical protein
MNKIKHYFPFISHIIVGSAFFLIILLMLLYLVPWYTVHDTFKVGKEVYYPGENVNLLVDRNALINLRGHTVVELIRVDDDIYHKIAEFSFWSDLEKGKKIVELNYKLPQHCNLVVSDPKCVNYVQNTYKWVGHIIYSPFGLVDRYIHFESETFQIKLKDEVCFVIEGTNNDRKISKYL